MGSVEKLQEQGSQESRKGDERVRVPLAQIEVERLQNIQRNKEMLKSLFDGVKPLKEELKSPNRQWRRRTLSMEPIRRSNRLRGKEAIHYESSDEYFPSDEEGEERSGRRVSKNFGKGKSTGPVNSGKGRRVYNGRVYDSVNGVTCHWCRQKTLDQKVTCTNENCRGGGVLKISFCEKCLRNRNGEDIEQALQSGCWICPCCRDSCGIGCISCCNCSFCRQSRGVNCTRQIIQKARRYGFDNVHDFLIYENTGESPKTIKARKLSFEWGKFLQAA
eukprot:TRINITY_DN2586_c0_g1_i2.p1 TRINITY_DN2586_c0_g1~~TRINITY_DN2586_c0_g1_i2.p1  ORF type:complete len:292 (-),score=14.56 TRINITY_DN2586_c0_g1_i2:46-870(-)